MCKIVEKEGKFYVEDGDKLLEVTGKIYADERNRQDRKNGKLWLKLPENSSGRKCIKEEDLVNGFELKPAVEKTTSGEKKSGPVKKYNWLDYVNEDEKKIVEDYNELMKKCIKRHEDRINNPEYQLKLSKLRKYQELLKMADEDEVETITSIIEKLKKELGL